MAAVTGAFSCPGDSALAGAGLEVAIEGLSAPGEAFIFWGTPDFRAGWTASYLAGLLESLGPDWQYIYPAFRVNGVLFPVGSYLLLDQTGSPYTPVLVLVGMAPNAQQAYLVPELAAALRALPAASQNALAYTLLNFGNGVVTGLRLFRDPNTMNPYALEISANPLLDSPVVVTP